MIIQVLIFISRKIRVAERDERNRFLYSAKLARPIAIRNKSGWAFGFGPLKLRG